jgi:parallel beta-helix repeat protein
MIILVFVFISVVFGAGANLLFITYEAEESNTNGEVLAFDTTYRSVSSESSGRRAVKLQKNGDYVEFKLKEASDGFILRFCIPDSSNGQGIQANISLYVNGTKSGQIELTSKFAWIYGNYPYTSTPDNLPHRYFDETKIFLSETLSAGSSIKFQKDAENSCEYFIIDLLEAEKVPELLYPNALPSHFVSISSFGAISSATQNSYTAFLNTLSNVTQSNKNVGGGSEYYSLFIPKGTYLINSTNGTIKLESDNISIVGNGFYYSSLIMAGSGNGFMIKANNILLRDFAIEGLVRQREGDPNICTAIESDYNILNMRQLTIQNVWIEHTTCGIWIHNMNGLLISGCRVRNVFADGIHLRKGTNNSVVENNHVRHSGDDGIAMCFLFFFY